MINIKSIQSTLVNVNKFMFNVVEDVVENTFESIEKWQTVGEKAVKGSLMLAAKQQDLVFDTLEMAKGQIKKDRG